MFNVDNTNMDVVVMPVEQLRTLLVEACSIALRHNCPPPLAPEADPYGDFKWLMATFPGVPVSTLRIKSAAGEIPGVVKFGKRVLYEKAVVLNYLRGNTRQAIDMAKIEQTADKQVSAQLHKQSYGGRKTA